MLGRQEQLTLIPAMQLSVVDSTHLMHMLVVNAWTRQATSAVTKIADSDDDDDG